MMTTGALIAELRKHDPEGEAQIFIANRDDGTEAWYSISKVNGFVNSPDSVIELGDLISGGGG